MFFLEYYNALKNIFLKIKENENLNNKEEQFKQIYLEITSNEKKVLHESIGEHLIDLMYIIELKDEITEKDCKEYLKIMSDDQRKSVAQQFCDMIRDEIFVFFASNKDCNGEYKESTNLMLDDWRSYWEDSLDTIILDAMSD